MTGEIRRWFYRRFLTRVEREGLNWKVSRPEWWSRGSSSGVSDVDADEARRQLDEWQDDMWRRAKS